MKVVIVGGVAGGAGCAARLRRLDETAEKPRRSSYSNEATISPMPTAACRTTSAMSSAPATPCSSLRRSR